MRDEVLLAAMLLAGCSGSDGSGESAPQPPTSGTYHHFVTTGLKVPLTATEQREYAIDIDGDAAKKPDNQLGSVFVALASSSSADIQGRIDKAVTTGKLVLLHSVRADTLAGDGSVSWQVYLGADKASPPRFDGTDTFEMAGDQGSEPVIGKTAGGSFAATRAGAGRVTIELSITENAQTLQLDLIEGRVEAHVDEAGCTGKLGGAVTTEDVQQVLLPNVAKMMNAAIVRDCAPECVEGTSGALILEVFDKDGNKSITDQELRDNSIIQTLVAPDLDLDRDGVRDAVSLGLAFDCVSASFTAPGEVP